jgi:hypothetical protein
MIDLFGDTTSICKSRQGQNRGRTYEQFVGKFKDKLTTDDCYTPENVYEAILDWVKRRANIPDDVRILRPFQPDGDYLAEDYSGNCIVIDNPPFSIISKICYNYERLGVQYFLFAPYLTLFNVAGKCKQITYIVSDVDIVYANGAKIPTSFVSNLFGDDKIILSATLCNAIKTANEANQPTFKAPRYIYPRNVISAALIGGLSNRAELVVKADECERVDALDAQRRTKKTIFGNGYFISDSAAKKLANVKIDTENAPIKWSLSDREKEIIKNLNKNVNVK